MANNYTSEEDTILRQMWTDKKSITEISIRLNRSVKSLHNRRFLLGLEPRTGGASNWTEEENSFIMANLTKLTHMEIAAALGKSKSAVSGRIKRIYEKNPNHVRKKRSPRPIKPQPLPIQEDGKVLLIDLNSRQCHFPCRGQLYCGEPNNKPYGYCDFHHQRIWVKP